MKQSAKLTQGRVNGLEPKAEKYTVWDDALKGFHVNVLPSGKKPYFFKSRLPDGTSCCPKLGDHGAITATQARALAMEAAAKVARGINPTAERREAKARRALEASSKLGAFLERHYFEHIEVAQKRSAETKRVLQREWAHLHGREMAAISELDVSRYRKAKSQTGISKATIERQITDLKSVLNFARRLGIIVRNPLEDVKRQKADQLGRVRYLTNEEATRLLSALDARQERQQDERQRYNQWRQARDLEPLSALDGDFTDYLKPMVLLALNTGMRRGELFSLEWRDVNLKGRLLTVQAAGTKTGQTRYIDLNDEAFTVLSVWASQTCGEGLVFTSPRTGGRFNNISKAWSNLVADAGIEDFRFHDCRHDFASRLVMAGEDLNTVRELLGHSSMDMTARYAHLAPDHKREALNRGAFRAGLN